MLQNPRIAFRDPELQQCAIEKNSLGQPKPRSGNFATVYRGVLADGGSVALRVFNRRADQRRQRYEAVSDYLDGRAITSFVDFVYDEQGIRSGADGKLYPLVRMDWVPGVTLLEWVRSAARARDAVALAGGAETWIELTRSLAEHQVAHGDLQPANVMVDDQGAFTLVDYDCLAVPALMGQPNLEMGLPAYQHPGRSASTTLFPGLDNFSALVIYVGLRALAAEPPLWDTFVDTPGYDGLLFRADDFALPRDSLLRARLLESPDEQVRDLAHYLFELVRYELHEIPPIDEVLVWCQPLAAVLARRDWELAVRLVESMSGAETISPELLPLVGEAYSRVASRQALERAAPPAETPQAAGRDAAEPLVGDTQAASLLSAAQQPLPEGDRTSNGESAELAELKSSLAESDREATFVTDGRLVSAWRAYTQTGAPRELAISQRVDAARSRVRRLKKLNQLASSVTLEGERQLIERARQLPPDYHPKLEPRIRLATERLEAFDKLAALLQASASEAAITAAAQACDRAGAMRFFSDAQRARAQLAVRRNALLSVLGVVSTLTDDARDRRLLELWDDKLLADCPEADHWRLLYQQARRRMPAGGDVLRRDQQERA
ncbi:MAG TPA: hypothetical protein VHY20_11560 [Pirellulales bacterium]|nr:hypothetical protein [Pirellulales bacterium]